jgi:hypothetical protein
MTQGPFKRCGGLAKEVADGLDYEVGRDGEIKGPGPFRSMSLMVLKSFRDLSHGRGPGFRWILNLFMALSGTARTEGSHV